MEFDNIHIIGVGGISMSGIAKVLIKRGYKVSGSDIKKNKQTEILESMGVKIYIGHKASNLKDAQAVVYTNAIDKKNVELQTAINKDIKIYKRAQFLSRLFKDKDTIAITGTHGKTTTTSMLTSIFVNTNLDPSVMIGGNLNLIGGNIKDGNGKYFITEADESDGSFTFFDPRYAIITNIEWDHFDYYKSEEDLINKFIEFIDKIPDNGGLIIWGEALKDYPQIKNHCKNIITYGLNNEDITAKNIIKKMFTTEFDLFIKGKFIDKINIKVPGEHNVLNALASFALSYTLKISPNEIKNGLNDYTGVKRRFDKKGVYNNAVVIDDYAHHPTEIINTIKTAKDLKHNKLFVVFQPHRYSRTKNLMKEFSRSFDGADELILTDIYAASESPIPGVNSNKLYNLVKKHKNDKNINMNVHYIKKFKDIEKYIKNKLNSGDILLTIGAGNVDKIGEKIVGG
ncbi:MAG: UDP-N-acetylmuramate--L-alanine ligase [Bacillota bacterium]